MNTKEQKARSDAQVAQQAVEAIQKQNEKRQQKAKEKKAVTVDGPVQLGKKIADDAEIRQMATITEEERSVVVPGYIFDEEVRTLRSERKLLIIKVTDYSSSMRIKVFAQ